MSNGISKICQIMREVSFLNFDRKYLLLTVIFRFLEIELLHFSDAHNLKSTSKYSVPDQRNVSYGGAARFKKAFELYRAKDKVVLFSGDLFFPSNCKLPDYFHFYLLTFPIMDLGSTHFSGEHMVEAFNQLNVKAACVGNNDIEMGLEKAEELFKKTNCKWVLSNIVDTSKDDKPIAGAEPYTIIDHQGIKIGVVAFADEAYVE